MSFRTIERLFEHLANICKLNNLNFKDDDDLITNMFFLLTALKICDEKLFNEISELNFNEFSKVLSKIKATIEPVSSYYGDDYYLPSEYVNFSAGAFKKFEYLENIIFEPGKGTGNIVSIFSKLLSLSRMSLADNDSETMNKIILQICEHINIIG